MSWFSNIKKSKDQVNVTEENEEGRNRSNTDPETCLEVFEKHWQQILTIMRSYDGHKLSLSQKNTPTKTRSGSVVSGSISTSVVSVAGDDVDAIMHYYGQMMCLLIEEEEDNGCQGPILRFVLTDNVIATLLDWSLGKSGDFMGKLKFEHLIQFEQLITQARQQLLVHKPIIRPLMKMLCSSADTKNTHIETHLVLLLHQLCVSLTKNAQLLELFFDASTEQGPTKFLMFSLLIPYVHREGSLGSQARDALLLIMTLSYKNESIGMYIANYSDFCPVLAAGLSGLFSSLPRKLHIASDDWYQLTPVDWVNIPELVMFLNSLEFCNAVIQVAHRRVRDQLLMFIYHGFLVPVLGPALHQDISGLPMAVLEKLFVNSMDEVIAATAYLDLFLRRITEPSLIRIFLRFILTEKHDEINILESLITRINSTSRLCMVTLGLFKTLVDMNCEDVMLQIVFRYLIPCKHVMLSQRRAVKDIDFYSKAADKLLTLIPYCHTTIANDQPLSNSLQNKEHLSSPSSNCSSSPSTPDSTPNISDSNDFVMVSKGLPSAELSPAVKTKRFGLGSLFQRSLSVSSTTSAVNQPVSPVSPVSPPPSPGISNLTLADYETSYQEYLDEASIQLKDCAVACQCWSASYDGDNPPTNAAIGLGVEASSPVIASDTMQALKSEVLQVLSNGPCNTLTNSTPGPNPNTVQSPAKETHNPNTTSVELNNFVGQLSKGPLTNRMGESGESETKTLPQSSDANTLTDESKNKRRSQEINSFIMTLKGVVTPTEDESLTMEDSLLEMDELFETFHLSDTENSVTSENTNSPATDSGIMETKQSCPTDLSKNKPMNTHQAHTCTIDDNSSEKVKPSLVADINEDSIEANISDVRSRPSSMNLGTKNKTETLKAAANDEQAGPTVGPFISALLTKLEGMVQNSLYVNLLVTGLITRLAYYPQPLLRSYLLNHNLVFQPTVKSLMQVLQSVKTKVESFSTTVDNFDDLLIRAWYYMSWKEDSYLRDIDIVNRHDSVSSVLSQPSGQSIMPSAMATSTSPVHVPYKEKKRGLAGWFSRRSDKTKEQYKGPALQKLSAGTYRYVNVKEQEKEKQSQSPQVKNAVYAALVLEEFIKELAAVSQEHAVLHLDEGYHSN